LPLIVLKSSARASNVKNTVNAKAKRRRITLKAFTG
jgi:hypothetical protein